MLTHGSVCRLCVCFTCVALAWNVGISASPAQSKSIHGVNLCQSGLTNNFATFILAKLLKTGHHPTAPKSLKSPSDQFYITFASIPILNMRFSFLAVVAALTAIMSVSATPALFDGRSCVSGTDCVGSACLCLPIEKWDVH